MDENEVKKDARYTYIDTKPGYSSSVLTGQWFNMRLESLPQSDTAIVPCVLLAKNASDKACERHLSTNQEDYSSRDFEQKIICRDFMDCNVQKLINSKSQRASQKYLDAEKYNNNFTSLNTLVYEMWPQMLQEQLGAAAKNTADMTAYKKVLHNWKPDRLDAYGNNSSIKRAVCKESPCPCPTPTVYQRDFIPRFPVMLDRPKLRDNIDRLG
ncbi:hypothetical protein KR093_009257 [Drosophila rubida]|uniref:Uncharacterized protein n=1 Tax=Drosophila rubida TaxID=30044 RepID=A0AAD4PL87_9MUSC|nr:hypothetical protein KR093_009257 [Drosophila rubida]